MPRHQKSWKKNDYSCPRDGVRAGRGSPCAVLLPLSMATSAPYLSPLGHPLPRTCSGFRSLPVGSVPLLSRPEKQDAPRSFQYWSEKKKTRAG